MERDNQQRNDRKEGLQDNQRQQQRDRDRLEQSQQADQDNRSSNRTELSRDLNPKDRR